MNVLRARWLTLLLAAGLMLMGLVGAAPAQASTTAFDPVPDSSPGNLLSPANGQMWVAVSTADGLRIDRYSGGTKTSTVYNGVPNGVMSGTATDDVWLNAGTALWHFDGTDWHEITLPTGPKGEAMYPTAMADVTGPDFYVMFQYFSDDGDAYAKTLGRYDGTSWTLLGEPSGDYDFESVTALAVTDDGIVALASTYRGLQEYVFSYVNGAWTTPVQVGHYLCCTYERWAYDWVVTSPTDIWLYGDDINDTANEAWCAHFDGTAIDDRPCVAGRSTSIAQAEALPDGTVMVGGDKFDRLKQPDQSTPVGALGMTSVRSMAVERGTGVVWAVVNGPNGDRLMRYGVATDASPFVVTAQLAKSQVEQKDLATVTGRIESVPPQAAQRTVVLEVKQGSTWKKVTTTRADSTGAYRFNVQQSTVGVFQLRVRKPASNGLLQGVSPTLTLTVRQPFKVTIAAPGTVKKGKKVVLTGKVTPTPQSEPSRALLVQTKVGKKWRALTDASTAASGRYRIELVFATTGTRTLRVVKLAADGLRQRASGSVKVKVVR